MPCGLDNGLYTRTASGPAIDRLPESRNTSKSREGQSFETINQNKGQEVHFYENVHNYQ